MPLAGVHIVATIAVLALIRRFLNLKISDRTILAGGLFGLLPDIDIPIAIALNFALGTDFYFHKLYTHAFIIPISLLVIFAILKYAKKEKAAVVALAAAVGWLLHDALDCFFAIGQAPTILPGAIGQLGMCREIVSLDTIVGIDAIVIWLFVAYLAFRIRGQTQQT